jgi:putative Holliday junction resolvase
VGRIVGVDYGSKKVGLSLADPLGLFAQPAGSFGPQQCLEHLAKMDSGEGIDVLVVGWPPPHGEEEKIHRSIRGWVKRAQRLLGNSEVVMVDESFSSREAEELLYQSGLGKKRRRERGRVDQAAASIILQRYLDSIS